MSSSTLTAVPAEFDLVAYAVRRDLEQALISAECAALALDALIADTGYASETMRALHGTLQEMSENIRTSITRLRQAEWEIRA